MKPIKSFLGSIFLTVLILMAAVTEVFSCTIYVDKKKTQKEILQKTLTHYNVSLKNLTHSAFSQFKWKGKETSHQCPEKIIYTTTLNFKYQVNEHVPKICQRKISITRTDMVMVRQSPQYAFKEITTKKCLEAIP